MKSKQGKANLTNVKRNYYYVKTSLVDVKRIYYYVKTSLVDVKRNYYYVKANLADIKTCLWKVSLIRRKQIWFIKTNMVYGKQI